MTSRLHRILLALALSWVVLCYGVLLFNQAGGTGNEYTWGGLRSYDLSQHYVAGLMWRAGDPSALYRNFQAGRELQAWRSGATGRPAQAREHFNYVYPPLVARTAAWLSGLSYGAWARGWFILSLACLAGAYLLLRRLLPRFSYGELLPLLLAAGFAAVPDFLLIGQNTGLTLLIMASAAFLIHSGTPVWAGVVLSCLFYKPQILPYIGLFMLATGNYRFILGLLAGTAGWALLSLSIASPQLHVDWVEAVWNMASGGQYEKAGLNQGLTGLCRAFFPDHTLAGRAGHAIGLAILLAAAWHIRHRSGDKPAAWCLLLAFPVWLAVSPYVGHYELALGLPWWLVVWHFRPAGAPERTPRWLPALFWTAGFVAIGGAFLGFPLTAPFLLAWLWFSVRAVYEH